MANENSMGVLRVIDFLFHLDIHLRRDFRYPGVNHLDIKWSTVAKHAHVGIFASSSGKLVVIAFKILLERLSNAF
jgi:hypothetical protein